MTEDQVKRAADLGVVMTTHTNRYIYKHGHILRDQFAFLQRSPKSSLRHGLQTGADLIHVALRLRHVVIAPTLLLLGHNRAAHGNRIDD